MDKTLFYYGCACKSCCILSVENYETDIIRCKPRYKECKSIFCACFVSNPINYFDVFKNACASGYLLFVDHYIRHHDCDKLVIEEGLRIAAHSGTMHIVEYLLSLKLHGIRYIVDSISGWKVSGEFDKLSNPVQQKLLKITRNIDQRITYDESYFAFKHHRYGYILQKIEVIIPLWDIRTLFETIFHHIRRSSETQELLDILDRMVTLARQYYFSARIICHKAMAYCLKHIDRYGDNIDSYIHLCSRFAWRYDTYTTKLPGKMVRCISKQPFKIIMKFLHAIEDYMNGFEFFSYPDIFRLFKCHISDHYQERIFMKKMLKMISQLQPSDLECRRYMDQVQFIALLSSETKFRRMCELLDSIPYEGFQRLFMANGAIYGYIRCKFLKELDSYLISDIANIICEYGLRMPE